MEKGTDQPSAYLFITHHTTWICCIHVTKKTWKLNFVIWSPIESQMKVHPMLKNFTARINYSSRTTNRTAKFPGKTMKGERSARENHVFPELAKLTWWWASSWGASNTVMLSFQITSLGTAATAFGLAFLAVHRTFWWNPQPHHQLDVHPLHSHPQMNSWISSQRRVRGGGSSSLQEQNQKHQT